MKRTQKCILHDEPEKEMMNIVRDESRGFVVIQQAFGCALSRPFSHS
jgi:hypothetical protein